MPRLHLALSGHEMAAVAVAGGMASSPRRKNVAGPNGKQRKKASLVVADEVEYDDARTTVHGGGDEIVTNSENRAAYRSCGTRQSRRAAGLRLAEVKRHLEADEFSTI